MRSIIFSILLAGLFLLAGWTMLQQAAPDFTLSDIEGKKVSLSDFKGKVVYIDFWATWCGPCMEQMNKAKHLKEHFKDSKDIVFLYVSIDKDEERWKEVVHRKGIKGVHLISRDAQEGGITEKYKFSAIPRYVLIDKEGNIADREAKWPGEDGIVEDIERLLKK